MHSASYFISPNDLWNLIGTAHAPQIVDVRRRDATTTGRARSIDPIQSPVFASAHDAVGSTPDDAS